MLQAVRLQPASPGDASGPAPGGAVLVFLRTTRAVPHNGSLAWLRIHQDSLAVRTRAATELVVVGDDNQAACADFYGADIVSTDAGGIR